MSAMKRFLVAPLLALAIVGTVSAEPGREYVGFAITGNNTLAVDLFRQVLRDSKRTDNVVLPAYAVSSGLAMTSGAAGPEVRTLMAAGARLPDEDILNPAYRAYNTTLTKQSGGSAGVNMNVGLALRGGGVRGHPLVFNDKFIALAENAYGLGKIRSDKAKEILAVGPPSPNDPVAPNIDGVAEAGPYPVALTVAGNFEGRLAAGFAADKDQMDFTLSDGKEKVKATMLRQHGRFDYAEVDGVQIVELPYPDRSIRLVLLMPKDPQAMAKLEQSMNIKTLPSTLNRVNPRDVEVILPRCEQLTSDLRLRPSLEKVGLSFTGPKPGDVALFLANLSNTSKEFYLSEVVARSEVKIDVDPMAPPNPPAVAGVPEFGKEKPALFKADRPFLFVIRDADYGTILYMGRVADPRKKP
jgi:serpin B